MDIHQGSWKPGFFVLMIYMKAVTIIILHLMTEYYPRGLAPSKRDSSHNIWLLKFSLAMKYSHIEKLKCSAEGGVK